MPRSTHDCGTPRPRPRVRLATRTLLSFACLGCGGTAIDATTVTSEPVACAVEPGPLPFRRLTRSEYGATVRDLLGDETDVAASFPPDDDGLGYAVAGTVTALSVELYLRAAEQLAHTAVRARLASLLPCAVPAVGTSLEDAQPCAVRFIDAMGRRAYRRPLTAPERARLGAVFAASHDDIGLADAPAAEVAAEVDAEVADAEAADADVALSNNDGEAPAAVEAERAAAPPTNVRFAHGIEQVLVAMLQSPRFLYRIEDAPVAPIEGNPDVVPLSGYERASRLSYFLLGSMPDAALFDAAQRGALDTRDGIEREARRLLAEPRAREATLDFAMQWLELEKLGDTAKDETLYPDWDAALKRSLEHSARRFVEHVWFDSTGTLAETFRSEEAFVDVRVADLFGVSMPSLRGGEDTDNPFVRVELPTTQRAGILTHAAMLARHGRADGSSPVLRGRYVRERLFCQPLPPPPDGEVTAPPDPDPNASTRARFAEHGENAECASCHRLMDPIGFTFEHYDGIGRYREEDGGAPVNAAGSLMGTRHTDGSFANAIELADQLAGSEDVRRCFVDQTWRYAFGRLVLPSDSCSFETAASAFEESGGNVQDLLVAITTTDAFLHRRLREAPVEDAR